MLKSLGLASKTVKYKQLRYNTNKILGSFSKFGFVIQITHPPGNKEETLSCRYFVNAGGPWAANVAQMAGIGDQTHPNPAMRTGLPVAPRRRCVFVVKCPDGDDVPNEITPLVVDTNGSYFRSEMNQSSFIAGGKPPEVNGLGIESFVL